MGYQSAGTHVEEMTENTLVRVLDKDNNDRDIVGIIMSPDNLPTSRLVYIPALGISGWVETSRLCWVDEEMGN